MSILSVCRRAVGSTRSVRRDATDTRTGGRANSSRWWGDETAIAPTVAGGDGARRRWSAERTPSLIGHAERDALRPLMRRYRRSTTVSAHRHADRFTWIDAHGWPHNGCVGDWHLRDRHHQWALCDLDFAFNFLPVLGERYYRTGKLAAVRLCRPATVLGIGADWFAAGGDWLVDDGYGDLRAIPARAFTANFTCCEPPVEHDRLPDWAARAAESLFCSLGSHWAHTQAVAEKAQRVAHILAEDERPLLIAAAWLHDIGKNPLIAAMGWHPIDGARALQGLVPDRLTALIAHHSGARYEADRRGMAELLGEFPRERSPLANALTYADLTVGVDGAPITVTERLADIGYRHGSRSILAAAIADATDKLVEQATDVERRLADHRVQQGPDNPEPARPSDSPIPLEAAVTATELVSALRRNGLSTLDIGRAVGVRHNTVSRWNNGTRTPSGSCCRRLGELRDVVVLVGGLPPLVITQWLRLPEPTLSGRSPLDAIAAGKKDRVATAASRIVAARRAAASTPSKEET